MKQKINLTESEFRNLISEQIQEALQDEALWGGIKNMFGKGASAAGKAISKGASAAGKAISKGAQSVGNMANQAGEKLSQGYNAAKDAYKEGSMEQDKQDAFKKCVKYYQKNRELFAKVNKMKGRIKQMANKYGFTVQEVQSAANGNALISLFYFITSPYLIYGDFFLYIQIN